MFFLSLTIQVVESQAIVLPLMLVCLKNSLNFVMKPSKVPRERVVEVKAKVSCQKVEACHILKFSKYNSGPPGPTLLRYIQTLVHSCIVHNSRLPDFT